MPFCNQEQVPKDEGIKEQTTIIRRTRSYLTSCTVYKLGLSRYHFKLHSDRISFQDNVRKVTINPGRL